MSPAPQSSAEKSLGEIVAEVSEKASLLVREEIALAKAEVTDKVKTLGKGAAVAAAAGAFLAFALITLLHTLAWFLTDLLDQPPWVGFGIVTLLLVAAGVVAGLQARKWLAAGPPTPDAAIREAQITRRTLEQQGTQRDQLGRSLERDR